MPRPYQSAGYPFRPRNSASAGTIHNVKQPFVQHHPHVLVAAANAKDF
jgi:hypothetical protein